MPSRCSFPITAFRVAPPPMAIEISDALWPSARMARSRSMRHSLQSTMLRFRISGGSGFRHRRTSLILGGGNARHNRKLWAPAAE